jgi:hypothetical protein
VRPKAAVEAELGCVVASFLTSIFDFSHRMRLLAIEIIFRLAELWRWTVQLVKKKDVGGLEDVSPRERILDGMASKTCGPPCCFSRSSSCGFPPPFLHSLPLPLIVARKAYV